MEAIQKACDIYTSKFKVDTQPTIRNNAVKKLDEDIHRYISIAVKSIPSPSNLFHNTSIFDTLIIALLSCVENEDGVLPLARAFKCLEKYFLLLVQQPWKSEYKTLKTYGGFYKTKIKSVLAQAETIFMSAGFELDRDYTMVYRKNEVDKEPLLILSFDCFVASELCERIAEHHNQLKTVGKTLDDAISDMLQKSWPKDSRRQKPSINKNVSQVIDPPELPKREPIHNDSSSKKLPPKTIVYSRGPSPVYDANVRSQDPEESLINVKYKPTSIEAHIPFIDKAVQYQKSSHTPHEESLKLVKEQQSKSEWKYNQALLSNPDSTTTYPPQLADISQPGLYPQWNRHPETVPNMEYIKDKGIISDTTTPAKSLMLLSALYGQTNPQSRVLSDQGYGTGNGFPSPMIISSDQELMSDTIHRPPPINSTPLIKNPVMGPPPIPSRSLKPNFISTGRSEDVVDGPMMVQYNNRTPVVLPVSTSHQDPTPAIGMTNSANGVRSPRSLHQVKSNSLDSNSKKLVKDSRVVKSMNHCYDQWNCRMCDWLNPSHTPNCLRCSFSRQDGLKEGEPKKPCEKCTFDNDWRATKCEVCEVSLPPLFVYKQP